MKCTSWWLELIISYCTLCNYMVYGNREARFIVVIILQCIQIWNHYITHLKPMLYVTFTSIIIFKNAVSRNTSVDPEPFQCHGLLLVVIVTLPWAIVRNLVKGLSLSKYVFRHLTLLFAKVTVKIAAFYFAHQPSTASEMGFLFSHDIFMPSFEFEVLVSCAWDFRI